MLGYHNYPDDILNDLGTGGIRLHLIDITMLQACILMNYNNGC